jgi:hypothetical protein
VTEAGGQRTNFRWVICALLFCATAINYMDRQIIGILKPSLQHDLAYLLPAARSISSLYWSFNYYLPA